MFPANSINDERHGGLVKPEILSDGGLRIALINALANAKNLFGGQLARCVTFALRGSSLRSRVLHVCGVVSLKEMGRIAARSPIASVANMESGPIAICEKERKPMGQVAASAGSVHSIPGIDNTSGPTPAFTLRALAGSLINVLPKGLNFLRGELRRIYSIPSHFSLQRLIWLGSSDCSNSSAGRLYFTTVHAEDLEYLEQFWRGGYGKAIGFRCEVDK